MKEYEETIRVWKELAKALKEEGDKKEKMSNDIRVGINGFGRIGRSVVRAMQKYPELRLVAVNDLAPADTLGFLLAHDSVHGKFEGVEVKGGKIYIRGQEATVLRNRVPENIPWEYHDVDVVVEATGLFRKREQAQGHLGGSVKKVIVTAPAVDPDVTIVPGANDPVYNHKIHSIISLASCTTNCLAPILNIIDDWHEVESGFLTTTHAYTGDQPILDLAGKDLRRSRAGAMNMIPTSTGAAKAIGDVIPSLKGKLDGLAIRVPVADVSIVDLVVKVKDATTSDYVNDQFKIAEKYMPNILQVSHEPLVSSDYIGDTHSAIVDALSTMVVNGNLVKVLAWYDNEIAYSNRVVEFIRGCFNGDHV